MFPVEPEALVHRIGGATLDRLRPNAIDRLAIPPGISVLLYEPAEEASQRMKLEYGDSKKWKKLAGIVATSTAARIAATGFSVIEAPTHTFPNHGRIIHPEGIAAFTGDNLERLSEAFATAEEFQ